MSQSQARLKIDLERRHGVINPRIYGQFMCRRPGCSDGGLYDPDAPDTDDFGIRQDVEALIRNLAPPVIRWPGGCTGTDYHWLDGVGPRAERPTKIDLHFGWPSDYGFGTDEFVTWCRRIGAEPHINVAMGTGTLSDAAAWLEYCNGTHATKYADLRRAHGHEEPHRVPFWQLGNEMYGAWEIGYTDAKAYGVEAREWAKVLKRLDPSISLLVVGGNPPNTPEWAWEVVPEVFPYTDYITLHDYWHANDAHDSWSQVMAGPHRTERAIQDVTTVIDLQRRRSGSRREVKIAITEWNCSPEGGMMKHHPEYLPFAPTYALQDALAVASFLHVMQRHCQSVTLAHMAQTLNVVGLIMVTPEGIWTEPIYWPLWLLRHQSGSIALDTWTECDTFDAPMEHLYGLPLLDASVTLDPDAGLLCVSLVNRSQTQDVDVHLSLEAGQVAAQGQQSLLHHADPMAMNSAAHPANVRLRTQELALHPSDLRLECPAHSHLVARLRLES